MPAGWGEDEQRFAAVVDTVDVTGIPLNAALRRDLQLVSMLRETGAVMSPDAEASARMKARLFAAIDGTTMPHKAARFDTAHTASLGSVESGSAVEAQPVAVKQLIGRVDNATALRGRHRTGGRNVRPASATPAASATSLQRARARHGVAGETARPRFPIIGAAAALLLIAVASMAMFISRDALPGDATYALKRVAENVGLGLTFDSVEKANRHLDLAATRMNEVAALLNSGQSANNPALVKQALQDFSTETAAASRLLLSDVQGVDAGQLSGLGEWAANKKASLNGLRSDMPPPTLTEADGSAAMLDRLHNRTEALNTRLPCRELSSGLKDDLGILPADGKCTPLPAGVDPSHARLPGEPAGLDPSKLGLAGPKSVAPGTNATSTDPSTSAAPSDVQVPAPGVGRVTIPPLLPGLPDIIIGS